MKNIVFLVLASIIAASCQQSVDERHFHANVQTINLDSLPTKKISINKHQYIEYYIIIFSLMPPFNIIFATFVTTIL